MVWLRAPTTFLWEYRISVNSVSKLATGTGDTTDPTEPIMTARTSHYLWLQMKIALLVISQVEARVPNWKQHHKKKATNGGWSLMASSVPPGIRVSAVTCRLLLPLLLPLSQA